MKLKGWHTQHIEIEIDKSYVIDAVIELLRKKHKLTEVDGIDEAGHMYENVEYATSHSWISKEDRGVPTNLQKTILGAIAELKILKNSA